MKDLSTWRIHAAAQNEETKRGYAGVPEQEVSLHEYWNILVKHRSIIIVLFLVVVVPGTYFALSATELYTASATIKIEPHNPQVTGVGEVQPNNVSGEYDYHKTQFALLQSRPLAARIISELGLGSNKTFTDAKIVSANPVDHVKSWIFLPFRILSSYVAPLFKAVGTTEESDSVKHVEVLSKLEPELSVSPSLIGRYLGFLAIAPIPQTRLVNVQFTTPDPALSQSLANAHVQSYLRMSLEDRFSLTQEAREFLDDKKNELQQKLQRSEAELSRFRRAHGVVSIDKGENIVVDRLLDLNKQLTTARAQRIDAESLHRTVENRKYQDIAEVMKQGLVQQLKSNLANLEAEKARSGTILKPDHPGIHQLNLQIAAARQALNNEVANVVQGIRSNYAAALAKERALEGEAEKQQRDALKLKELGVQYTVLQEEVNANRALFASVLKRLSETNVSNDVAVSNMQIVERAAKPLVASAPNVQLYLLASVVSGLFLGMGAAFLREFFDSTVTTPDRVWRSVGLGTLGVVPHLKFVNRSAYGGRQIVGRKKPALSRGSRLPASELITLHNPRSILTETYRTIRTSLLLSQAEKPPQVILLTSPSPGEGKTVTSLNLGIALAHDGHTVLIVDADMRMGCCHHRLGLTNNRGLSNVLTGRLSLDEGIQATRVRQLSLLSRGVPPPNPSELLGSGKMKDLLNELRQRFEFILIDSTPVMAISDATILSVIADGVLLVFDGQKTSITCAQRAVERLDTVRARLLGVVLNGVNLDDPDYSYYRTYSHYYQASNEHEQANVQSAKNSYRASENGLRAVSRKDYLGFELRNEAHGEGVGHDHDDERAKPIDDSSLEMNERISVSWSVSQAFMDRLVNTFIEAVGPIGPRIVREKIAALGESHQAFPRCRIDELIKSMEREISHPDMRLRFQQTIADDLRDFESH